MYRFTNNLPERVCRICGAEFDERWSSGGVGAVCQRCAPLRDNTDLVEIGIIRNLQKINNSKHNPLSGSPSYTFEAKIDDKWYECSGPCGNWSYVDGWGKHHDIFSVPVGWWELDELYKKHGSAAGAVMRCHRCNNEVFVPSCKHNKVAVICPICSNNNTYYFGNEAAC